MENEKNMAMPEFTNEAVEKAIKQFLDEKSNENMANLMQAMRDTRFLVPADFPPDIKKQVIEKAKRGEKIDVKTAPRMLPIIVQNPQGEHFAPAYTSSKQMAEKGKYPAILNVTIDELLRIGSNPSLKLKGIIVNPDTDKMILHPKFIDAMKQLKAAQKQGTAPQGKPEVKELKMSRAQFELFARRTCEWGIIPRVVYNENAEFMKKLEEKQGKFMATLYRQPYGDKLPCPYSEKDFEIMILDIDEETCVASIELPKQNMAPQMAHSMYIVWNPQNNEMRYFTIEQGMPNEDNVLCSVDAAGKREELQTAPPTGSEISAVLELVREDREDAQAE